MRRSCPNRRKLQVKIVPHPAPEGAASMLKHWAIVDACSNAWKALIDETGRIQSIASRDWLMYVSS
jgi:hypothetical protein